MIIFRFFLDKSGTKGDAIALLFYYAESDRAFLSICFKFRQTAKKWFLTLVLSSWIFDAWF